MKKQTSVILKDQSTFVWSLLHLYLMKGMAEDVIGLASSIYEQKFEFSEQLEKLIVELWETSDVKLIFKIAKFSVWQHMFDAEKHIFIVAILFGMGEIDIKDAAVLCSYGYETHPHPLNEKIKYVIDVSWLIIEDWKDNVMSPDNDNLLAEALRSVCSLVIGNPSQIN